MQRTILTFCLLLLLLVPIIAQEEQATLEDMVGMTVPQAEAVINQLGYRLDPIILSNNEGTTPLNTVIEYTLDEGAELVQVMVRREYNVELIWENATEFASTVALRGLTGDELFNIANLSNEQLSLRNIQLGTFDSSQWGPILRPQQCAQIWTTNEDMGHRLPECTAIQDTIINLTNADDAFWQINDSFDVHQNGVYRGTCETAEGRCQLWLSPFEIAEDIAQYIYFSYNNSQFIVYNNSDDLWMDISHLKISDDQALSEPRDWNETIRADLSRLAPNQCVRFTRNADDELLIDCDVIATQFVGQGDLFWRSDFTVQDTLRRDEAYDCPAASGAETVCLLNR